MLSAIGAARVVTKDIARIIDDYAESTTERQELFKAETIATIRAGATSGARVAGATSGGWSPIRYRISVSDVWGHGVMQWHAFPVWLRKISRQLRIIGRPVSLHVTPQQQLEYRVCRLPNGRWKCWFCGETGPQKVTLMSAAHDHSVGLSMDTLGLTPIDLNVYG